MNKWLARVLPRDRRAAGKTRPGNLWDAQRKTTPLQMTLYEIRIASRRYCFARKKHIQNKIKYL
jgi:hypothetical protein